MTWSLEATTLHIAFGAHVCWNYGCLTDNMVKLLRRPVKTCRQRALECWFLSPDAWPACQSHEPHEHPGWRPHCLAYTPDRKDFRLRDPYPHGLHASMGKYCKATVPGISAKACTLCHSIHLFTDAVKTGPSIPCLTYADGRKTRYHLKLAGEASTSTAGRKTHRRPQIQPKSKR